MLRLQLGLRILQLYADGRIGPTYLFRLIFRQFYAFCFSKLIVSVAVRILILLHAAVFFCFVS